MKCFAMKKRKVHSRKRRIGWGLGILLLAAIFWFAFPGELFPVPYARVALAEDGRLLAAEIAEDGQWRFAPLEKTPEKAALATRFFEDEYFYRHPGVNPVSLFRALRANRKAGKIVEGGSTISMQVIRMSLGNPPRTYLQKLKEVYLAIRLTAGCSKDQVMRLYLSHAPYGGNVVGIRAASWRYFDRSVDQLSWAETATLAVLPNAPGLIHPGRNRAALLRKRDALLRKLYDKGILDEETLSLALMEPLPSKPYPIPQVSPHLLQHQEAKKSAWVQTSIDHALQVQVQSRLNAYTRITEETGISNAAVLVVSLSNGAVKAYCANAQNEATRSPYVDLILAPRSSGSILKPLLYAKAFEKGRVQPSSWLRDVPITIGTFSPKNFDKRFEGIVPADEALSRSLNVPAAILLKEYGLGPFYKDLQSMRFSTLHAGPDHYGLSLILGGAEVTLWDLAAVYAREVSVLCHGHGRQADVHIVQSDSIHRVPRQLDPAAAYMVSEALTNVQRPSLNEHWKSFGSSREISWKTGTSHGFRDAWAVGWDGDFLVAVWCGNADGEGRPGLTGTTIAAPLLFQTFELLPRGTPLEKPHGQFTTKTVCATSGLRPTPACPSAYVQVPKAANTLAPCRYHKTIFLDKDGMRVRKDCGEIAKDTAWLVLDPVADFYYAQKHVGLPAMPPLATNCPSSTQHLAVVYPYEATVITVPKAFSGERAKVMLEATHRASDATVYWHLDDAYIGATQAPHQLPVDLPQGKHRLTIVDGVGSTSSIRFDVLWAE